MKIRGLLFVDHLVCIPVVSSVVGRRLAYRDARRVMYQDYR